MRTEQRDRGRNEKRLPQCFATLPLSQALSGLIAQWLLLILLLLSPSIALGAKVQTLDGGEHEVTSFQLDARGLSATADGKTLQLSATELLEVEFSASSKRAVADTPMQSPHLSTIYGEVFPIQEFTASQGVARFRSALSKEPIELPTKKIDYVRLIKFVQESGEDWERLLDQQEAGDLLVLAKKNKETGDVTMDALSGVVEQVGDQSIDFIWDGEPFPVKRTKVAAVVYYRGKKPAAPKPFCVVHTRDGAVIPCQRLETSETGTGFEMKSLSGINLNLPFKKILKLDFSNGKLVYLSDLKPLAQKWTPLIGISGDNEFLRRAGEPRFNQAFTGSTLQLASNDPTQEAVSYSRGIALRSRTEIVFEIPPRMRKFQVLAGINPATARQGHVELEFSSKGKPLWQGQINGHDPPESIEFELNNVKRLRIFVDYGENLDFGDQLHLINPRVSQ